MDAFWQRVSGVELAQGDLLRGCPVPVVGPGFTSGSQVQDILVRVFDLIVITQSCDLANRKIQLVAACPIYSISQFEMANPGFKSRGRWEEVRKGRTEGLHLLASPTEPQNNRAVMVVDFREIYSLPLGFMERLAAESQNRWRLKSPFLEHFSQAFARFFMRVGLPAAIPKFD